MKNKKITRIPLGETEQDKYVFFGLVSPEPDYKISLFLNKRFRISLKLSDPVRIPESTSDTFSRFSTDTLNNVTYSLVANRSEGEFLLKKIKNVDYILILHDHNNEFDTLKLAADLREVESVTGVFRIDPGSLKDKNIQYLIR